MKFLKELSLLLHDQQLWKRLGISVVPGGLISFFLKVQGNPEALYVGIYTWLFFFILLVSWHVLSAKVTVLGLIPLGKDQPEEKIENKYITLRPVAIGISVALLAGTSVLVFVPPYN